MIDQGILDPVQDARLAARIFLQSPLRLGGMVLRGSSPARDALVAAIADQIACRKLPGHVDDERLLGGVDIAASLAAGRPVEAKGLLAEAAGGCLIVPMAERMEPAISGRLAQALDDRSLALILLDDGIEADEGPPLALLERIAFHCDLSTSREREVSALSGDEKCAQRPLPPLSPDQSQALATSAAALGISSLRPLFFADEAARIHAALSDREEAVQEDCEAAARLVLAPRALQLPDAPPPEEPPPEEPPPPPDDPSDPTEDDANTQDQSLEDLIVAAAAAAIPADLLEQLTKGKAPRGAGSGSGKKRKSGLRGKPLGARAGTPSANARLALIDSLRAAVPWQMVRRKERADTPQSSPDRPIIVRKDDLRVRRFEEKAARLTIFAVDASGSAAAARLAEAKGAVELMLAQAYVTRSEVALIAFRGECAELLLPPTRSLTRARRALAELPGGGGTPLALGLEAALECAEAALAKGRTPSIVVLTDGRANVDAAGQPGRKQAGEDAEKAAKAIARSGVDALVVDISARPGREGGELAKAMLARFLALPMADAQKLHSAIKAVQSDRVAA